MSNIDIGNNDITFSADCGSKQSGIVVFYGKSITARNIIFIENNEAEDKIIVGSGTISVQHGIEAKLASVIGSGLDIKAETVDIFDLSGRTKIFADTVDICRFDKILTDPRDEDMPIVLARKISFDEKEVFGHGKFIALEKINLWNNYGEGLRLFSLGSIEAFIRNPKPMDVMSYAFARDASRSMSVSDASKIRVITHYPTFCETAYEPVEYIEDPSEGIFYGLSEVEMQGLKDDYGVSQDILDLHGIAALPIVFKDFIREAVELIRQEFGDSVLEGHPDLLAEINADAARRNGLEARLPQPSVT